MRLVEDAWESAARVVDDLLNTLTEGVETAWDQLANGAEQAWEALATASETAWNAAAAAVEGAAGTLVDMIEVSIELMVRVVEFFGELIAEAWELIKRLGACLAGILILQITKADNVIENFWKVPKPLPGSYRTDIEPVFGGKSFWNVWYIDDARLAADWYNDSTSAMTMSGITLAGVTLSHLIFLTRPWNGTDNADRELMAHELVHVLQYRRLVTDPAFGCAYGIGYEESGFDYWAHPMENAARDFVTANSALI
jgi:hypothetical protein